MRVRTFVPPWNSYDANTVRALEDLGFGVISADSVHCAHRASSLQFVPATCGLSDVRRAVAAARERQEDEPLIVVLFHQYDFVEADAKRGRLRVGDLSRLLDWLAEQGDVRVLTIGETVRVMGDLSVSRLLANYTYRKAYQTAALLLPPSFLRPSPQYAYLDAGEARARALRARGLLLSWYFALLGGVVVATLQFSRILLRVSPRATSPILWGAVGTLAMLAAYGFWDGSVGYRGASVSALFLGAGVAAWAETRKHRHRVRLAEAGPKSEQTPHNGRQSSTQPGYQGVRTRPRPAGADSRR
jgi:hypothetical protein